MALQASSEQWAARAVSVQLTELSPPRARLSQGGSLPASLLNP